MTRCLAYVLFGATLIPVLACPILAIFAVPIWLADRWLEISPLWGVLAGLSIFGAFLGGRAYEEDRRRTQTSGE